MRVCQFRHNCLVLCCPRNNRDYTPFLSVCQILFSKKENFFQNTMHRSQAIRRRRIARDLCYLSSYILFHILDQSLTHSALAGNQLYKVCSHLISHSNLKEVHAKDGLIGEHIL